jgi:hypothetical protein
MPLHEKDLQELKDRELSSKSNNFQERLQQQQRTINTPAQCDKCGSTFFYTVHAEQFAAGGFGTVEFRSLTASPVPTRVCLCGTVLMSSRSAAGGSRTVLAAREAFYDSVNGAKHYKEKLTPDKIAQATASRSEVESLKAQVDELTALIDQLTTKLSEISAPKFELSTPVKKSKKSSGVSEALTPKA